MKINKKLKNEVRGNALKIGDLFLFGDRICIKTGEGDLKTPVGFFDDGCFVTSKINCVDLNTGQFLYVGSGNTVTLLDGELTVWGKRENV